MFNILLNDNDALEICLTADVSQCLHGGGGNSCLLKIRDIILRKAVADGNFPFLDRYGVLNADVVDALNSNQVEKNLFLGGAGCLVPVIDKALSGE